MFNITKDTIYLTRGDTAFIEVQITDENGDAYYPVEGDKVYFRLKRGVSQKVCLLEKELSIVTEEAEEGEEPTVKVVLELEEDDTKDFSFANYCYEIELVTSQAHHFTIIENGTFTVGPELEIHAKEEPEPEPEQDNSENSDG